MVNNIPEGATHQWKPNDGPMLVGNVVRLGYYKKCEDEDYWMVYSPLTGWRKTANDLVWFAEETRLGFFKEIV